MTPPAIFDTVVLLQAATNPDGPAGACLRLVTDGKLTLLMSGAGLAELADVLGRAKVRRKFPKLTPQAVETFLQGLRARAQIPTDVPAAFHYQRDPDDEHILNTAIAGAARYLVTRDNDLLDLAKPDSADGAALRQHCPELTILDPVALLRVLAPKGDPSAGAS